MHINTSAINLIALSGVRQNRTRVLRRQVRGTAG